MNRGVMMKAVREIWGTTLLLGVLLFVVEAVLAYVLPTFASQFAVQMTQFKFVQNIIQATIGADMGQSIGEEVFLAIAWVHPVVLALVWAHAIVTATRVPAGEVDRGTIDVLLGLPVSRWGVYVSETLVWGGAGTIILLAALAGNALGSSRVAHATNLSPVRMAMVVVNLWAMYLAVGGGASFLSALSSRRGKAMTASFVIVVGSFLVNYLAQLWAPAKRLEFLSVLKYYRPVNALKDGVWPVRDIVVLLIVAAVLWVAGGLVFARRDLTTT
jgi:ABC-type transport system involved in multi-copper enzyme maturation permease subunit